MQLRIREILDERGLTLEQGEELTGIDHTTLSKLSNGRVRFHQEHLEKLCKGFGVDPCELFAVSARTRRASRAAAMFDQLPESLQDAVLTYLRMLSEQQLLETEHE